MLRFLRIVFFFPLLFSCLDALISLAFLSIICNWLYMKPSTWLCYGLRLIPTRFPTDCHHTLQQYKDRFFLTSLTLSPLTSLVILHIRMVWLQRTFSAPSCVLLFFLPSCRRPRPRRPRPATRLLSRGVASFYACTNGSFFHFESTYLHAIFFFLSRVSFDFSRKFRFAVYPLFLYGFRSG